MRQFFTPIGQFIRSNSSRFVWELIAVAIGIGATWLISRLTGQGELQNCQDERATLLRQNASAQSFADSVKWSAVVNEKQNQIHQLQNENNELKEAAALDAAAGHSELESMRAINDRYKTK